MTQEQTRYQIYRSLTSIEHREITPIINAIRKEIVGDPYFGVRCAVWLAKRSKIRDQVDASIAALLTSPPNLDEFILSESREAGKALIGADFYRTEGLNGYEAVEPYRVLRTLKLLYSYTPRPKRLLDTILNDYLAMLEKDPERFDGVVELNRANMVWAYKKIHRPTGDRVQRILFDDSPPATSRFWKLREAAKIADVRERALDIIRISQEHRISFLTAASMLPKGDPVVHLVELELMTPNQVANSVQRLEASGILQNPEAREVFNRKLNEAKSASSLRHRKSSQAQSAEVKAMVEKATDRAAVVKRSEQVEGRTGVLIDISSSMGKAIETGKELLSRLVPIIDNPNVNLQISMFNGHGSTLRPREYTLSGILRELGNLRAHGNTNVVAGFSQFDNFLFDRFIIITDGGENAPGMGWFARKYAERQEKEGRVLPLTVIYVPGGYDGTSQFNPFHRTLEAAGLTVERLDYSGDYYILDNVMAFVGRKPGKSVVDEILAVELPRVVGLKV